MNVDGAIYQDCRRIALQEMHRINHRRIGIWDEEDLRQELTLAALRGAERSDGRPGDGYVRKSVRNAIAQLYAHVAAAKRHPKDRFNRPIWFANQDIVDVSVDEAMPDPEALAMAREQVNKLVSSLPRAEAMLLRLAADGEIELTPQEAEHIRYTKTGGRMSDEYAIPEGKQENLASCHVRGSDPEGYDASERICQQVCVDKFSCLPEAVAQPSVWMDRTATVWAVDDDHEVAAVLARDMTFKEAIGRVADRVALTDEEQLIPAELLVRRVSDVVDPDPPVEAEPDVPAEESAPAQEDPVAAKKKASKKKATKKKAPKRPSKKKVTKKKATKKEVPARPRKPTVAGTTTVTKSLPKPTTITEEKMVGMLERVKLGKRIDFEWGMQIVRRNRDGSEHAVTITRNGFLYKDKHYSSLSAVAQNASGTFCRSGNDWFGMHHRGAEVRTAKGKVIASRTVGS